MDELRICPFRDLKITEECPRMTEYFQCKGFDWKTEDAHCRVILMKTRADDDLLDRMAGALDSSTVHIHLLSSDPVSQCIIGGNRQLLAELKARKDSG